GGGGIRFERSRPRFGGDGAAVAALCGSGRSYCRLCANAQTLRKTASGQTGSRGGPSRFRTWSAEAGGCFSFSKHSAKRSGARGKGRQRVSKPTHSLFWRLRTIGGNRAGRNGHRLQGAAAEAGPACRRKDDS